MNEKLNEILLFANQNPSSWLATNDGNQPRVRGMLMWFADETGFYYHTADKKAVARQILKNPLVEAAFSRKMDQPDFECMRVTGTAEVIHDKELEKRLMEERPWLQGNMDQSGVETELFMFRIVKGEAYIWSMAYNIKESEAPRVQF